MTAEQLLKIEIMRLREMAAALAGHLALMTHEYAPNWDDALLRCVICTQHQLAFLHTTPLQLMAPWLNEDEDTDDGAV